MAISHSYGLGAHSHSYGLGWGLPGFVKDAANFVKDAAIETAATAIVGGALPVYQIIKGESDPIKALKMAAGDICAVTGNATVQTGAAAASASGEPHAVAAGQVVQTTSGVCNLVKTPAPPPPKPAAGVKLSILKLPTATVPKYPAGSIAWRDPTIGFRIAVPRGAAGLSGLAEWNWYQVNTNDYPYLATTDGGLGATPYVEVATAASLPTGVTEVTPKEGKALITPWYKRTWFFASVAVIAVGGGALAYRRWRRR